MPPTAGLIYLRSKESPIYAVSHHQGHSAAEDAVSVPSKNKDIFNPHVLYLMLDLSDTIISFLGTNGQPLGGTITLQAALPAITQSYNINGPNPGPLTVDGDSSAGSIFTVNKGVTASISNLTITGGNAVEGGGIYNSGTLTLTNDNVYTNTAGGSGGGLYNAGGGKVTISGSEFYNNRASNGGGIFNSGSKGAATLDIENGTVIDYNIVKAGPGGGLYNASGKVMMTGGPIYENSSSFGGGIYTVGGGGNVALTYVYLYANFAQTGNGGGILENDGSLLLKGGTVQGNTAKSGQGGGIYLMSGTLSLFAGGTGDVTIGGGNTAKTGGGLYLANGTTNFGGCDVGGNTATVKAAGVAYTTKAKLNPPLPIPAADLTDADDPGGQPVLV